MDDKHELLYIGGGWRKPVTAGRIEVTSASTEESLGRRARGRGGRHRSRGGRGPVRLRGPGRLGEPGRGQAGGSAGDVRGSNAAAFARNEQEISR
jgi:hypothetical protein